MSTTNEVRTPDRSAEMAVSLFERGAPYHAVPYLAEAIRGFPERYEYRRMMCEALVAAGQYEAAVRWLDMLLAGAPNDLELLGLKGLSLERLGRSGDALALLWPLVEAGATNQTILYSAALAARQHPGDLQRYYDALVVPWASCASGPSRGRSTFALADLLDRMGRYDEAFRLYRMANDESQAPYDLDGFESSVEASLRLFRGDRPTSVPGGCTDDRPVFICGMPRSGTSIVEQVLTSHSAVHGVGETPALSGAISQKLGGPESNLRIWDWPEHCASMTDAERETMAQTYVQGLGAVPETARRVTDKTPANVNFLGLIAEILPHARVVICERDRMDTGWSCYRTGFNQFQRFSSRLDWIAHRLDHTARLADHAVEKLPLATYRLSFEAFVASPETEIPKLVDFCGLKMEEACLSPEQNDRLVHTASYAQVRRRINRSGVGRYRPYEAWLEPLRMPR